MEDLDQRINKTALKAVAVGIGIYWIAAVVVLALITLNSCNQTVTKVLDIPEKQLTKPVTASLFGAWTLGVKTAGGACNGVESLSKIVMDSKDSTIVSIALTGVTHFESSGSCVVDNYENKTAIIKEGLLADTQTKTSLQLYFDTVLNAPGNDSSVTMVTELAKDRLVITNRLNDATDTLTLIRAGKGGE